MAVAMKSRSRWTLDTTDTPTGVCPVLSTMSTRWTSRTVVDMSTVSTGSGRCISTSVMEPPAARYCTSNDPQCFRPQSKSLDSRQPLAPVFGPQSPAATLAAGFSALSEPRGIGAQCL
jgi:hypothetical protein